jgi:TorA maturation chaperone TorD
MSEVLRDRIDDALARAVVYRTLSIGFLAPTGERLRQADAPHGFPVAAAALRRLDRDAPALGAAAETLARLSVPDVDTLEALYWRLFGHTARGPICACETEYGPANGWQQAQELANVSGYYHAFGVRPAAASEARADHIATECEFMDLLSRKEALLLSDRHRAPQNVETINVTRGAGRTFVRDHLGRFGRAFATRVASEDGDGYFGGLARVLLAYLEAECARLGVAAGPVDLAVRPDWRDPAPMACGPADELIQIQRHR